MEPVFADDDGRRARAAFFTELRAAAAAPCPALRIGRQPYGILPDDGVLADALARAARRPSRPAGRGSAFLRRLLRAAARGRRGLGATGRRRGARRRAGGDPHQTLLDVARPAPGVGRVPPALRREPRAPVQPAQLCGLRRALLAALHRARLDARGRDAARAARLRAARTARRSSTSSSSAASSALRRAASSTTGRCRRPTPVRAYTTDGAQLPASGSSTRRARRSTRCGARRASPATSRRRRCSTCCCATRCSSATATRACGCTRRPGCSTRASAAPRAREPPFVHVARAAAGEREPLRAALLATRAAITGSAGARLARLHRRACSATLGRRRELARAARGARAAGATRRRRGSSARSPSTSTAAAYRLDAWRLGLVHAAARDDARRRDGGEAAARRGRPPRRLRLARGRAARAARARRRSQLDAELADGLRPTATRRSLRDSANGGYVHAPSLNHAVDRGGAAQRLPRQRRAGRRRDAGGQPVLRAGAARARRCSRGCATARALGALLGYRLERGLHDRHGLAEVDQFIYALRKAFPLRGRPARSRHATDRRTCRSRRSRRATSSTACALVEHVDATRRARRTRSAARRCRAADAAAGGGDRRRGATGCSTSHDAVADLALAEGVHQAVLGNFDRVAATLDAYSDGRLPARARGGRARRAAASRSRTASALHLDPGADPRLAGRRRRDDAARAGRAGGQRVARRRAARRPATSAAR